MIFVHPLVTLAEGRSDAMTNVSIMKFAFAVLLLCAPLSVAWAQADATRRPSNAELIDSLVLPELPKGKTKADFDRDSNVTTQTTDGETITEFRFKGKLYKMVVKPKQGAAYTLIDEKGDGKFVRVGEPGTKITVPMWVILSW